MSSINLPPEGAQPAAPFDPNAPHQQKPKLRAVRGFPVNVGGQQAMGLADAKQVSDRMVVTAPAFQVVLPLMDGTRTIDEIVAQVGRGLAREHVEPLVAQLDDAGLIFGPKFDAMIAALRAEFDGSDTLPPAATAQFVEALGASEAGQEATPQDREKAGVRKLKELFDTWIAKSLENVDNPSFDALPKAVIAPHLDYPRGWLNYAAVYGRMRVVDRPDRIVILGTNHFGEGTGVVACNKSYQTPLGTCELDRELLDRLVGALGEGLVANRYDHEREHSIELHLPWIQHCMGEGGVFPKVLGVLVHDPAVNNGESYDGRGVALMPFVEALRGAIASLPGKTLIVASADLSHVGPAFGDPQAMAGDTPEVGAARNKVFQHDREMLDLVRNNKPDELVAAMAWQQNPTRWCSTGNIVAALKLVNPDDVEILNYAAAMDEQGNAMVSSAAVVMN
ncbi:MAG: AmmeMemoRadiSam system protein B [Phycisphaeraceae bacterium]|nr:MAG: AmmeMemoRadiSam system protein B [Phycisphaeraceae bacterium]